MKNVRQEYTKLKKTLRKMAVTGKIICLATTRT